MGPLHLNMSHNIVIDNHLSNLKFKCKLGVCASFPSVLVHSRARSKWVSWSQCTLAHLPAHWPSHRTLHHVCLPHLESSQLSINKRNKFIGEKLISPRKNHWLQVTKTHQNLRQDTIGLTGKPCSVQSNCGFLCVLWSAFQENLWRMLLTLIRWSVEIDSTCDWNLYTCHCISN